MFTGIVEEVGIIKETDGSHLVIAAKKVLEGTLTGDSIAVDGVCLTVTALTPDAFSADVMPETMRRTALGSLKKGSRVNLERALTLSSRLGGHIVTGHIDGAGRVISIRPEKNARRVEIGAAENILRYIVPQGSVALNGVSLTVAEAGASHFTVALIPHTRDATTFSALAAGAAINIECDILGKYVEKLLPGTPKKSGGITEKFLREYGF